MLNAQRLANYARQAGVFFPQAGPARGKMPGVTPAQIRRMKHKQFGLKTHGHAKIVDADGNKIPCSICKPAARQRVTVKAAPGPRDWTPGKESAA